MSDKISLYCHFHKIVKEPGTSFQAPALSQKHVRNVSHTTQISHTAQISIWPNFILIVVRIYKK